MLPRLSSAKWIDVKIIPLDGDSKAAPYQTKPCAEPWLQELAKRWIRLRLSSGRNVETIVGNLRAGERRRLVVAGKRVARVSR